MATTARINVLDSLAPSTRSGSHGTMRSSGIEELKVVLRRSALLIVAVVVIGVLTMNILRQVAGPHYTASARVLLNNSTDLSSGVLGISQPYQDPTRVDQAEQNLVNSPQLYDYAAQRAHGAVGTGGELMAQTSGTVSNNVIGFTSGAANSDRAVQAVNAVASAYPSWRAQVRGKAIDTAISQIRAREEQSGKTAELDRQLEQLQVLKTLSAGETLFVDQAGGATKTTPRPVKDSLLGAAMGLVIALLIVGARELFDTTVRSESDVEDALDAPVLAKIESMPRRLRASVLNSHEGRFNDEYELLAANIAQIFDGHSGTVQLAVTSAMAGEGKTTTASNLAAALSRRGARVMLADFDLRKPAVSDFVGIPRGAAGVSELLARGADLRSVLWRLKTNNGAGPSSEQLYTAEPASVGRLAKAGSNGESVAETSEGSLMVMPGGALRTESASYFAKLPALLERLPADTDFVVIDTPPALLVAGMAELAQSVDGVIVVVRHGFVHRRRLRTLGRQARSWRARLLGAVLNDSPNDQGYLNYYYGRP
jgi:Mrp family chromosome partitioning ATPase